jgi:hypothetical protein
LDGGIRTRRDAAPGFAERRPKSAENRAARRKPFRTLRFEREIDHQNHVFLDNANEQNHPNRRDDVEPGVTWQEREDRAIPARVPLCRHFLRENRSTERHAGV